MKASDWTKCEKCNGPVLVGMRCGACMDHEGLLDEKRRLERELFELKAKNVELQAKVDDQQDRLEKICDVLEKTNYYDPEHVVKLHKNELDEYYLHSMAMVKAAVDLTGMWITGPEKMPG